ncbi:MAG TPA: TonB-dependent receptor, partial [Candidatus Ozemobacteraceae bacterium]|nr:TonB-dependent receptor [Candidatus Ozemobacteraceae bacterium]
MRKSFSLSLRALVAIFFMAGAVVGYSEEQTYKLSDLNIDAERATYQSLIARPQDEIASSAIELKLQRNPIKMLHSHNPSIVFDGGLRGATITPSYRGFGGKYMAITLDGCPINTGWNGTSPLSGFPMSRLQKITVVPGGAGLVYGANSVAGAVNFVLPTARDLEDLTITQEIGGDGKRHQEYIYGHVSEKSEHLFALFMDEYDGDRRFKDFNNFNDAANKTNPKSSVNLGTINNRNDSNSFLYRGKLELENDWTLKATILENQGSISCPSFYERFEPWNMSLYDYTIEKDFGDNGNLTLRYAKYKDFSSTWAYPNDKDLQIGTLNANGDVLVKMDTMELLYNIEANDRNFVTVGAIKQEIEDIGHGFDTGTRKKVDTTGYFVSDNIKATDKLDLNVTGRSDTDYEGDAEFSWALGSNYAINDNTSASLSLSRVTRNPNMQELYRSNGRGNPNLKAEDIDNLELRLNHKFNEKWQASLAWFDSDIENYIEADANNKFQNIKEAEISGIELSVNGRINDKFTAWVGYTDFNKAENKTDNLRLVSKPEFRAVAGTTYSYNKLSAMLTMSHQGETEAIGATYPKVDASTMFDLNIRQQATKDLAIYLNVENLTD